MARVTTSQVVKEIHGQCVYQAYGASGIGPQMYVIEALKIKRPLGTVSLSAVIRVAYSIG